jgi:uncharacterized protein
MVQQQVAGIVKDDVGRVRSGWVVLTFAACNTVLYFALRALTARVGLYPKTPTRLDDWGLLGSSSAVFFSALGASLLCKLLFKAELGLHPPVGRGLAIGAAAGIMATSIASLGGLAVENASITWGGATVGAGLMQLAAIGPTSVGEELLIRGVVFRQLARGLHPGVAILATGAFFGVMHLGNPNVSLIAAANIALVGVWFGLLVWRTGTLWSSIALHVVWNWFEGFVYGTPVSGLLPAASVVTIDSGTIPGFWTGGRFGPEAAGVTTVMLALATLATFAWPKATPGSLARSPGTAGSPPSK